MTSQGCHKRGSTLCVISFVYTRSSTHRVRHGCISVHSDPCNSRKSHRVSVPAESKLTHSCLSSIPLLSTTACSFTYINSQCKHAAGLNQAVSVHELSPGYCSRPACLMTPCLRYDTSLCRHTISIPQVLSHPQPSLCGQVPVHRKVVLQRAGQLCRVLHRPTSGESSLSNGQSRVRCSVLRQLESWSACQTEQWTPTASFTVCCPARKSSSAAGQQLLPDSRSLFLSCSFLVAVLTCHSARTHKNTLPLCCHFHQSIPKLPCRHSHPSL